VDGSVVRVTRQITTLAGTGLSGGDYLSADLGLSILLAATNPGLSMASGLTVDSSVARTTTHIDTTAPLGGGGDLSATRTLFINFAAPSGLSTAGGLAVADTLQGSGLVWSTPKVLAVDFTQVARASTRMIAGAGLTGDGTRRRCHLQCRGR
jgi:hypothetical protein